MARSTHKYPATLQGVMDWAFEGHENPGKRKRLNIDDLVRKGNTDGGKGLKKKSRAAIRSNVDALIHSGQFRGRFSAEDKRILAVVLDGGGQRNVKIHSMKVLRFMRNLIYRESTVPPPWRA